MLSTSISPINWQQFAESIHSATRVLLTAHQRPDADCIGSELAMRQILLELKKEVRIINPHRTPPTLMFLDRDQIITPLEQLSDSDRNWINQIDLFFVLDTSSWTQLGAMAEIFKASSAQKIVLDHHENGELGNAKLFVDPDAEATGILVVQAADVLGVPLNPVAAEAAFAAVATDTGWFRFHSVKSETYQVAARLVKDGAVPAKIYRELYEQISYGRLRLVGRTLAQAESLLNGKIMFAKILLEDFDAVGALSSDSEDIINMLLQVKNSQMAILISELKDKSFKISFRSRCGVDCSRLAEQFSGGGHKAAAGASSNLSFEETRLAVLQATETALKNES